MVAAALAAVAIMACRSEPPFMQMAQARDLSADMNVQFITAIDASSKAIMADTNEQAATFVGDAEGARQAVTASVTALDPVLRELGYAPESELLRTFADRFAKYQALDRQILSLTVENTNRTAQRLSFGPSRQEADAVRDAVDALDAAAGQNAWQVKALAQTAVAGVRDIQALYAPHIAEAGDEAMTGMEKRMAASETAARTALRGLTPLVRDASRPQLAAANAALDRFMRVHAEIMTLSRRNTNVRSLALSLNEKGRLTADCEDGLAALREALAKRAFAATR
jgi:hypothetical protein